jgi:hypothetical protein
MSVATWAAVALLAGLPSSAPPDAGTRAGCAPVDRNDLQPGDESFDPKNRARRSFWAAVWADLVEPARDAPVLMVRTTNFGGAPETTVFAAKKPGSKGARVVVRRYRENLWVAMLDWGARQRRTVKLAAGWDEEREYLKTASPKIETFEADLDEEAFAVIERVWSSMVDRARPYVRRTKVITLCNGDQYHFRSRERQAGGPPGESGSLTEAFTDLGKMLAAYPTTAPRERAPLRDKLVTDAAALEANIHRWNDCERATRDAGTSSPEFPARPDAAAH